MRLTKPSGPAMRISDEYRPIAILGCFGVNFLARVLPVLGKLDPKLIVGYDRVEQCERPVPFEFVQVQDDDALAWHLRRQQPRVVLIETPDQCHASHIPIAIESGARLILCEKPLAVSVAEADQLAQLCRQAEPDQRVYIIDHYLNLELVKVMFSICNAFVDHIDTIEVALLESQGIPEKQVRAHANGMANFIFHGFAFAAKLRAAGDLQVAESVWAKHPECPVPDSYRAAVLTSRKDPNLTIRCAAGKYIQQPRKHLSLGSHSAAMLLDRDARELQIITADGWGMTLHSDPDTGYRGLARCLETAEPLPAFLTVQEAREIVRLVDEAIAKSTELDIYPDGSVSVFDVKSQPSIKRAA